MVTSLALGQSYDCPSASEVTLKFMYQTDLYLATTQHKYTHNSGNEPYLNDHIIASDYLKLGRCNIDLVEDFTYYCC